MNINNVYVGNIYIVIEKEYYNESVHTRSKKVRTTLLFKRNNYYLDLLSNNKYACLDDMAFLKIGEEYIGFKDGIIPLMSLIEDRKEQKNLFMSPNRTKRKIKKLYDEINR